MISLDRLAFAVQRHPILKYRLVRLVYHNSFMALYVADPEVMVEGLVPPIYTT